MARRSSYAARTVRTALSLMVAMGASTSLAGTTIHRCETEDGVRVYTDRPCSELDAVPRAAPVVVDADGTSLIRSIGGAPACPAPTLDALPRALERAFASGDVNQLSSLYHWTGLGAHDAARVLGRFETMLQRPLLEAGIGSAGGLTPVLAGEDTHTLAGADAWLALGPSQDPEHVRFSVVNNAGCVWLQF